MCVPLLSAASSAPAKPSSITRAPLDVKVSTTLAEPCSSVPGEGSCEAAPARPGTAGSCCAAASTRRTNLFGITEPVFEGGGGGILACCHKLLFTHSLVMPRGPRGCSRCGGSARLPAGGSRWCQHGSVQASSRLTAVSHSSLKPLIPGASCFGNSFTL